MEVMAYAEPYDKENTQQTNLRRKNKLQPGRIQTVPPGLLLHMQLYSDISRYLPPALAGRRP